MTEPPATDADAAHADESDDRSSGRVPTADGNAPEDPDAATVALRIGQRVTRLRRERGLSLSELAVRAGIGKATLSGVEAGTRNPTLETLYAITGQLGLPLAAVLAEPTLESAPEPACVGAVHGDAVSAQLLSVFDEPTVTFEFYRLRIRPGRRQLSPAHSAGTTEHLTVFSGTGLAGPSHDPLVLAPGGYVTWAADQPHIFEAEDEVIGALMIRSPRLG